MKLKQWLAKTDKLMKGNIYDHRHIRYVAGMYQGKEYVNIITQNQLKEYPLLLDATVVKEKVYDSEYILASFTSTNCGSGKCKQYSCWLDADQVKIAFKNKEVKKI